MPPLRDRREDIAPFAQQIIDSASKELGLEPALLSEEVLGLLQGHGFSGNVRQLRRIIEQALRMSRCPIKPEDISLQAQRWRCSGADPGREGEVDEGVDLPSRPPWLIQCLAPTAGLSNRPRHCR